MSQIPLTNLLRLFKEATVAFSPPFLARTSRSCRACKRRDLSKLHPLQGGVSGSFRRPLSMGNFCSKSSKQVSVMPENAPKEKDKEKDKEKKDAKEPPRSPPQKPADERKGPRLAVLPLRWTAEEYGTGIKLVDEQHQSLFRAMDQIIDIWDDDEDAKEQAKQLIKQLDFLEDYAKNHFATEEKLMAKYATESYAMEVATHKQEHQAFTKKVDEFKDQQRKVTDAMEQQFLIETVLRYLRSWIITHIHIQVGGVPPFCCVLPLLRLSSAPSSPLLNRDRNEMPAPLSISQSLLLLGIHSIALFRVSLFCALLCLDLLGRRLTRNQSPWAFAPAFPPYILTLPTAATIVSVSHPVLSFPSFPTVSRYFSNILHPLLFT